MIDPTKKEYEQPHPWINKVINIFKKNEVENVLDLGCGSGIHLEILAQNGFEATGIDFSPSAASIAEQRLKKSNLPGKVFVSEIHEKIIFLDDAEYDAVIATDSIHYTDKETFSKTIKEINRILKTDGLFFGTVPSKEAIIENSEGQIFFAKEEILNLLNATFQIIEFDLDIEKFFSFIGSEK
ncbi:MAG TPA: class I SAM-dependent methyltransferase [Candidatus Dojkabacteria bacterium]|jgi:ubiquinone/menaquinone biosynthesis C-methylase UbiE